MKAVGESVADPLMSYDNNVSGSVARYRTVARRPGGLAENFADPALAGKVLGWQAQPGVDAMCADIWRWQQRAVKNSADLELKLGAE